MQLGAPYATVWAMFWIAAAPAPAAAGRAPAATAGRGAPRAGATGASGIAIAVGGGLLVWGAVALLVGLLTEG